MNETGNPLMFNGMPIIVSPHVPAGQAFVMDNKIIVQSLDHMTDALARANDQMKELGDAMRKSTGITGKQITGMWLDEYDDIAGEGYLRRKALRELAQEKTQSELEAMPGFGTF